MFVINAVIVIGAGLTAIFNFWALLIGRLMVGWGAGAASVLCPLFVQEIAPAEVAGSIGAVVQNQITFGFMVSYSLGFAVPYEFTKDDQPNDELNTSTIWRWIFLIPGFVAIFQTLAMLIIFRDDTPKFYEQKGNLERVEIVNKKIFTEEGYKLNLSDNTPLNETQEKQSVVTFKQLFGPGYRYALLVGSILCTLNQFTGITAVLFYSNEIFQQGLSGYKAEHEARIGTILVGCALFGTSFLSSSLLARFGRKTIFIFGFVGMLASLATLGVISIFDWEIGIKIFTISFVTFFGFSIGTVMWLYNAEILPEAGISFATFINWAFTILFSLFTNQGFKALHPEGMYFLF